MARSVGGGERSDGGGRCCTPDRRGAVVPLPLPPPQELDLLLSKYVLFHMYLLKAVTGLGYLALTWSTVVLLGGFITALTKKDFWCITVISLMQAARIFHDLADQLLPNFFKLVTHIIRHNSEVLRHRVRHVTESFRAKHPFPTVAPRVASVAFVALAVLPFVAMCYVPAFLYVYGGPVACIALAIWRTVQRDYGDDDNNDDKANLAPALDMFYALVLLQGGLLLVWLYHESWWVDHLITLRQQCRLPETAWCRRALVEFLCDTRKRCWRDLSSVRGRRLVEYAVGLLDSGRWDDNLSAARLLDEFIRRQEGTPNDVDVRTLLLPSRSKIQKLIDALGWRDGDGRRRRPGDAAEMRKLAARIVAHLAGDLHLAQFPGAIQCISYLLLHQDEASTLPCSGDQDKQQGMLTHGSQRRLASEKQAMILKLQKREERRRRKQQQRHGVPMMQQQQVQEDVDNGGACSELILQGLAILERLASDRHNCSDICSSPGLLRKITAPLYSGTFVRDIKISTDWVQVANATFKVVYQLIQAPGETSAKLRIEIAENDQAMSNLVKTIVRQEAPQELKMRGMEILTELALDSCINLPRETRRTLMKNQMHIFLHADDGDLKATAGRTLALTKCGDESSFDRLVEILDDKNIEIQYKMIAAEILENMCVRCDKQRVKEILSKVLTTIMSDQREETQTGNDAPHNIEENKKNHARGQDVENQKFSALRDQKKSSDHGNEDQTATKEMKARLLSLILAIYDKLISADDFENVLQNIKVPPELFVAKLKTIVEENRQVTISSLKIVKLCGKIAISMIRRNQYTEQLKNKKFVDALAEASETMSNLESCMLFAGTEYRRQMTVEPPLSSLVEDAVQLVG